MPSFKPIVAIVDDEAAIRSALCEFFVDKGYSTQEYGNLQGASLGFESSPPDVAIMDLFLPDGNALKILPRLRAIRIPAIVLTGKGTIDLAVSAMKEGAEHVATKPVELEVIHNLVERAVAAERNRRKAAATSSRSARNAKDPFVGISAAIRRLRLEVERIATTELPILIHGETGTGKGVLASWLHQHGPRADESFVDLNCAGLPRDLLESELFGYEKGAFTGAVSSKQGLLDIAHHGTVFLDEMGDMDTAIQPKLLKVLEEKKFRPLGGVKDRLIDVHLIAATNADLLKAVAEGRFRADLFYRINTIPLRIPPLRERPEDIPLIASMFLAHLRARMGRPGLEFSPEAVVALRNHNWPGNIRELRNVIERAVLISQDDILQPSSLSFQSNSGSGTSPVPSLQLSSLTLPELERAHILSVLAEEGGSVQAAALRLGIPRSTLYAKLRQYGKHAIPQRP